MENKLKAVWSWLCTFIQADAHLIAGPDSIHARVLLPYRRSTEEGCPLHGLYFSLRSTCANTSSGNYKWKEASATGLGVHQKGNAEGRRAKGRMEWSGQVSLESFPLLAWQNHALPGRKKKTKNKNKIQNKTKNHTDAFIFAHPSFSFTPFTFTFTSILSFISILICFDLPSLPF